MEIFLFENIYTVILPTTHQTSTIYKQNILVRQVGANLVIIADGE